MTETELVATNGMKRELQVLFVFATSATNFEALEK